jgi:serine/threonine protein kinase
MNTEPCQDVRSAELLPPDAPDGLCPQCVMAMNLKTETVFSGDTPAAQPPLPPEQIAPHFPQLEILECLGRGGMGVVYKARQKSLNRLVALKLLAPERVRDAKFAERFAREAQALAALNHPNIVTIYDFGQAGGFYYLLMEFVDGLNLRQLLRTRKFTPEEALAIVPPLCDALQFAHDRGIVHRDIKPENLLLDKTGKVKVADFGIAKMLGTVNGNGISGGSASPENVTQSVVGTPSYSAPEQKTDPQRVDSRADIYSLGVVFYEMLTGELPGKQLQPPSRKVQIDVRLDEIVLRALEKKPELRFQQVSEVKTLVETIVATPPGSSRREEAQTESGRQKAGSGNPGENLVPSAATKFSPWQPVIALLGMIGCLVLFIIGFILPFPANLIPLVIMPIGIFVAGLKLAGFWPWPSPLFPKSNFTGRNLPGHKPHDTSADRPLDFTRPMKQAVALIKSNWRSYMAVNILFYGVVICGMMVAAFHPEIQERLLVSLRAGAKHSLPWVTDAYQSENIPAAIFLTFAVNSFVGAGLMITLPSLLIPFAGFIVVFLRAGVWGLSMSPTTNYWQIMIPHSLTLFLEGQAYILAAFGSYLLGRWFLFPRTAGFESHKQGYWAGLKANFSLYPLILTILAISAVYEVSEVIVLKHILPAKQLAMQPGVHQDAHGAFRKDSNQSFPLKADGRFSIENIKGLIEIHGWSSNAVVINSSIHGETGKDVEAVKISIDSDLDRVIVHTEQPSNATGFRQQNEASVDYTIQVPQHARLANIRSVNGSIVIDGIRGDLTVSIVNGTITADMSSLGSGQSVSLDAVNGGIELSVPGDADANFFVNTVNGGISSEFPALKAEKKFPGGNSLKGSLGSGGANVKISTVNGGVNLRSKLVQPSNSGVAFTKPNVTTDQIVVEDLALQMIVAIREKDNDTLRSLATDRIKGWRDALPVFATELREHYRQNMGNEAFDLRASESLVEGDLAAVRCTGPAELKGKCFVLFFVKTAGGWRNYSLRASMDNVPLSEHMANLKKGIEKEDVGASTPKPDGSPADDVSKAAVSVAEKWLAAIDGGNYSLTWKDASAFFQASVTEQAWNTSMEGFRKPLGNLVSRKLKSVQPATSLPGAPDGEYVVMQFDTSFAAKKTAVETVTFTHEKAGSWRASGYYIR